jgi:hypothetical protein
MLKRAPSLLRWIAVVGLYSLAIPLALIAWPAMRIGALADLAAALLDVADDLMAPS